MNILEYFCPAKKSACIFSESSEKKERKSNGQDCPGVEICNQVERTNFCHFCGVISEVPS
ncbi:MAG: hypothetical protein PHV02_05115 [Rhodocyclaceae bacterium]|nr:hypothetical protein [Rhodocyclaceae bacterium]